MTTNDLPFDNTLMMMNSLKGYLTTDEELAFMQLLFSSSASIKGANYGLAKKDLEQIQTESTRLDFLVENRLRVERWNTSPCTEFYYVMNDEDVSITQHEDLRTAVDLAMEQLKKEEEEQ